MRHSLSLAKLSSAVAVSAAIGIALSSNDLFADEEIKPSAAVAAPLAIPREGGAAEGEVGAVAAEQDQTEDSDLDLARKLVGAQRQIAELKRADFIEAGAGDQTRAKYPQAIKDYEKLREEVLRRRSTRLEKAVIVAQRQNFEIKFNGVTSYVELPTMKFDGQMPYTVEAIISPEPIPSLKVNPEVHEYAHCMAIIADTEYGGIELGLQPDKLSFDVKADAGWYVNASKPCLPFAKTRMHIAGVLVEDEIRLYVNGRLAARAPFKGAVGLSPFAIQIGSSPHPITECHEMFYGRIDEVRISQAAQYDEDFEPALELAADEGTVALYHFDEGQGEEVHDASGNGNHGFIHDARWVRVGD